jgi:hypothetical protein
LCGLFKPKYIEWAYIFVTFKAACKVMMTEGNVLCGSFELLHGYVFEITTFVYLSLCGMVVRTLRKVDQKYL